VDKIAKKYNLKECVFVNSALKMKCHIVKNTLLQAAFLAIKVKESYENDVFNLSCFLKRFLKRQ